ncbi:soluble scavenger receptor cysteine-rich domain-containing protein SSC5D-like [Gopherus flavomarginatus]|uniref:soluble scavenger receptor cysteine-rich domain-containing protein SSC5D-like n=1 Tax=Gopherus flavomarginatus TaxID=286002 RepID=UPI0021CBAC0A|nr:soluble scavenger receptor cysteine-rich domain-containing protein SSC5D-like [Gopherus flavomarginatus]
MELLCYGSDPKLLQTSIDISTTQHIIISKFHSLPLFHPCFKKIIFQHSRKGSGHLFLLALTSVQLHGNACGALVGLTVSEQSQLQLVNSQSRCTGRVEVLHNQQWGTVCDHSWDLRDAGVVCRQLGCGTALSAPGRAQFGQGSDPIWLNDVRCTGTEAAITECRAKPRGVHNCTHGEIAGVVCSGLSISEPAQLQLVNGPLHCAGRVEVFLSQQWGTVCDDDWDFLDARVVCKQQGCGMASLAPHDAHFGRGSHLIWLDRVNCTRTEAVLSECRARPWGVHDCYHAEDASVVCSGNPHS